MGRAPRADEAGGIYHALNRGNALHDIFFNESDFEAFERLVAEGLEKFPVNLIAYQWMSNHWHMVLSPREDGGMSAFIGWVTLTHTQRYHAHHGTAGSGHVYQGRYKSFPIQDDDHFYTVCRYVERNALTANLVKRAENYRWGSLSNWLGGDSVIETAKWPIRRLPNWTERVNKALTKKELDSLRHSVKRSVPYGDEGWTKATVKRLGLESTTRPRGRPRVRP
ncbi:transposase [Planctomycetota bacterium]